MMSNRKRIPLRTIAEAIDETFSGWTQFLNTKTGEIVSLSDPAEIPWEEEDVELAEEIEESDDYERLPDQFEIHEFRIMEAFAASVSNEYQSGRLFRALNGRKPYRHFKDEIKYLGIDQQYYAFRFSEYMVIAKQWCERHDVPYIEEQ